jgi:hypothetical protein
MAYILLGLRVLVEPDVGKTDRGIVVEGYAPSTIEWSNPPEGQPRVGTKIYHTHIVFCEGMAQLVTQGEKDYYCMHRDAILGYLT